MKTLRDPGQILTDGLAAIRLQYQLPDAFPPEVIAEAEAAVKRPLSDHIDKTEMHFVTLDPASSMDLDQAFLIELRGADNIGPMSAFDPTQTFGYVCYEAAGEICCECTG